MDEASIINPLLEALKSPDEKIRNWATQELWKHWFGQKGVYGLQLLQQSQALVEAGKIEQAEALLTEVIEAQPDFAEAWNRRAVLYYMNGQYQRALTDCERVVKLSPIHFGALHGMGLCYVALGNYSAAIQALRRALEIQPYAVENQRLILECSAQLS
ncbi:tetratricopeptide repeat protein [Gloeocapsopsis crepidinum LEGE 06123]|uniref:Tetratricopeptide repeat protein n=1 Tax=Gloeocapsopsis crepidinum LEGE 06123 TaxID=588587 RepID=A0ABR9UNK2_9CHRO|nr:tetratricopeptide repeat protein [Gloeocapsopsis crepidinum]MBE9189605.1 tetratricopeptide repeat protein [Gloeocapsopsis crepidinum LEGE 06123]